MIERYTRKEMAEIWSAATKYRIWFEIEAHGCDALAELGVIPKEAAKNICCLLYTSPSPRDQRGSRMPSSA